ncbi:lanosterol 14-alpha-demethylase [Coprinopsis cinerea okayama7|uniref:Lanosterol 14-alpha-demethylase n=1 Tax=Coprinopsis cinerea (strain Okayama-7 / 130 / ATCC MYA-4618 / FGSC 9003) TaxID=240176 RepID=A8NAA8_COPC7|nr:lanosterol 14-alpha-demethylase [Coprinopsis cinerea okayama7\|eukprot:XP_001831760.1 lanosterol 14-alpha-demethylase [Coprinopsis cinerea okayama7\
MGLDLVKLGFFLAVVPVATILLNVLRQLLFPTRAPNPPEVFHWIPIVGSALQYGNDPINFFFKCREKYGDVFTFILLGRRITVALGPKGNNFILGGKSTVFNAEDAYTHLITPVFGKDVVYDVPNEKFMQQKRFIKAGISTENLRAYVGMIEEEVEDFLEKDPSFATYQQRNPANEWGRFNAVKTMQEITILTASRTLQGREVRSSLTKEFAQTYNDLDGGLTPLNFLFPNLPLESYRRRDRAQKKMSDFYIDIIKKRKLAQVEEVEHDMIASLSEQRYRSGAPLPDHEIAHIMIALLMAGQHTSSATSSWALLHLAHNVEVAEALYNEQVEHFSNPDGSFRPLTYDELRALPILDSVIRETLRMHPPIHSIMRYVRDDVVVPGSLAAASEDKTYVIPKGNYVLASPVVSQMDPRIWRNPEKWEPARWSDPNGVAAQAYSTYVDGNGEKIDYGFGAVSKGTESPYQPFGAGKHRCIGEQFAYLQLGTLIATIIRKLELRVDKVPEHNYHTMILMPKAPDVISYRRRNV